MRRIWAGLVVAFSVTAVAVPLPVVAQVQSDAARWVGSPWEEYQRLLQLTGAAPLSSLMLRPTAPGARDTVLGADDAWRSPWAARYSARRDSARWPVRLSILAPVTLATFNSEIPHGTNDGAMWAGRGTSLDVTTGVRAAWRGVTVQLAPEFSWSQNQAFPLGTLRGPPPPPTTAFPYDDRWLSARIDMPQRFGDAPYSRVSPGQSSVSVAGRGVKAGVSTENMWWGPGIDNSLLMSNNAQGFTHAYVGTQHPLDIKIGRLEVLYTMGWLQTSAFWRSAADTFPKDRWLNSLSFVFEPRGAPGMYFGAGRLFYAYERDYPITPREMASVFQTFRKESLADSANPHGEDRRDQLLSLWFRWVFPQAGFEAYGELGRNDHNWDLRDFNVEPEHSGAYLLGARKVFRVGDGVLSVRAEAVNLTSAQTLFLRPTPTWYEHHIVQQGFTNLGQVIGAGIGPGGQQQTFVADWFHRRGRVGFFVQREVPNFDSFYRANHVDTLGLYNYQEAELSAGPRVTVWWRGMQVDFSYAKHVWYNRYNVYQSDVTNQHLELRAQYLLP